MLTTTDNNGDTKSRNSKYQYIKVIGEGSFSTVYLCKETTTNMHFAVKKCSKQTLFSKKAVKHVLTEKDILLKLSNQHPYIIQLYETFTTKDSIQFVLEFCENNDLLNLIDTGKPLSYESVIFYTTQLILALEFIHSKDIVHRDIKPANILLDREMNIKLSDFGTAMIKGLSEEVDHSGRRSSFVGTAEYVSPEVLKGEEVDYRCDLWALGCVIFHIIVGFPPFRSFSNAGTFSKVMKCALLYPDDFDNLEEDAHDLISTLVVLDPSERLGNGEKGFLESVRRHQFLESVDWSLGFDERKSPEIGGVSEGENFVERSFMSRSPVELNFVKKYEKSGCAVMEIISAQRRKKVLVDVNRVKYKTENTLLVRLESNYEFEIVCSCGDSAKMLAESSNLNCTF